MLGSSVAVTAVAVLGGAGVLPSSADPLPVSGDVATLEAGGLRESAETSGSAADSTAAEPSASADDQRVQQRAVDPSTLLPPDSGEGRRVVFSQSAQRVWLVKRADRVVSTYLASGSVTDNLQPGTYEVYSRSENAVGIDDSGTMKWFVRFTQGPSGAAIGFHDIPIDEGARVQTFDQLGTPQSHGCIRQKRSDAKALWDFAPLGSTVVVTA